MRTDPSAAAWASHQPALIDLTEAGHTAADRIAVGHTGSVRMQVLWATWTVKVAGQH